MAEELNNNAENNNNENNNGNVGKTEKRPSVFLVGLKRAGRWIYEFPSRHPKLCNAVGFASAVAAASAISAATMSYTFDAIEKHKAAKGTNTLPGVDEIPKLPDSGEAIDVDFKVEDAADTAEVITF